MTRREWLAMIAATPLAKAYADSPAPAAPVAMARCQTYDDVAAKMGVLFDQLGGIGKLVAGKTVTVKVNMTGPPFFRVQGRPVARTHYTHPKLLGAAAYLFGKAGARRVRFVESGPGTVAPLEEVMKDAGWNVREIASAAPLVEFENTATLGSGKRYSRLTVPSSPYMFAGFDLNHSYAETDVFVSMAKLKNHVTCGVTLSLKNCFGTLPTSIYGDDAGRDEPNEYTTQGRQTVGHDGRRQPSKSAPQQLHFGEKLDAGYRVPHIVADLVSARPIHLAIIDGVESIAGGEGPWNPGLRIVTPGLLIAGLNPVSTDAVAVAAMGYNPRATRGTRPFQTCDNTLLLAEQHGVGSTDLKRIDVRGLSIEQALYRYDG